jgi:ubiquinol-cytochrome c reductase iron-sulfur subunit
MRVVRWLGRWILAAIVLAVARRPPAPPTPEGPQPNPRAEAIVLLLLTVVPLGALAFAVVYFTNANTQLLGLSIGGALLLLAIACAVAAVKVLPQEEGVKERPELDRDEEAETALEEYEKPGEAVSRRRLLKLAAGGSVAAVGGALALPALSLGPDANRALTESPWRKGRRLVDEHDRPIAAADIAVGGFTTAFPEGAYKEAVASPLIVVRVRPEELHLPDARHDWAPQGILAFSKICTHAGCAVSEFRYPLFQPISPPPAVVCPCHLSTFDVTRGGKVTFGPAGRALPQLPLAIDADGNLVAAGDFSGHPGPSWWGVRR